jgi:hypothetical protein
MKRRIQARILEEEAGLNASQRRARANERIAADPILGPIWKQARPIRQSTVEPTSRS